MQLPDNMLRWLVTVTMMGAFVAGSGCRALVELVESDDVAGADGGAGTADADSDRVDADIDCATWTYTPEHFDPCEIPSAGDGLVLGPGLWTYDTNSGALTDPQFDATFPASTLASQLGGPEVRIVSASYVEVQAGAILRATGLRPLVIVSWSDIVIDGTIDVGGTRASTGAGANAAMCSDTAATIGSSSTEGAGGGGGGGFGSAGGGGGPGDGGLTAAGTGGTAIGVPATVRGGCSGAIGGNSLAGAGGPGGGALHLAARDSITIDGVLNAGGAGGGGSGGDRSGGSGAGSGGLLELQAVTITLGSAAIVTSNGGGGGGGSDGGIAFWGQDALTAAAAATGGSGQGMGEAGGDGAFAAIEAEAGVMSGRGGGGGGGGVGFIIVRAPTFEDSSAVLSPAAQEL